MSEELDQHLAEWHTFDKEAVAKMVAEHNNLMELAPDIKYMVRDLYGKKDPVPGDPDRRGGGRLEKYDAAMEKLSNGGIGIHLSPGAWVAIAAFITGVAGIAIALLGIAFGSG